MSVILSHLGIDKKDLVVSFEDTKTWVFTEKLKEKNFDFFKDKIAKTANLKFLYSVLVTKFCHDIKTTSKEKLCTQVEELLAFAEYLRCINLFYLKSFVDANSFENDIRFFKKFLFSWQYNFPQDKSHIQSLGFEKKVKDVTVELNWPRFFVIRGRRFFLNLDLLLHDCQIYHDGLINIEKFSMPVVNYFSWMFFVPRLLVNIFNFTKHLIPGFWMDSEERKVNLKTRIAAQLPERWFELVNDSIWLIGGLINCFLFIGPMAFASFFLIAAMQAADVVVSSLRLYIKTSRMNEIAGIYNDDESRVKEFLDIRIRYEQSRLLLHIIQSTLVCISLVLILPVFSSAFALMTGSLLLVLATTVCFFCDLYLQKNTPVKTIGDIKKDIQEDTKKDVSAPLIKHSIFNNKDVTNESELICDNYPNLAT